MKQLKYRLGNHNKQQIHRLKILHGRLYGVFHRVSNYLEKNFAPDRPDRSFPPPAVTLEAAAQGRETRPWAAADGEDGAGRLPRPTGPGRPDSPSTLTVR